ncbi:NAD-dependent epimerase/dehydratase family protein [Pontibacter sp. 13R65]|uniref:NAD-dependent epimerase/dehydratase family protein n=1 Tax=Pontibacter sp. 13R65 TaxID=3127458 RepID=UPI00301CA45C
MALCVIFGGAGFVGTHLATHFLKSKRFTKVHIADLRETALQDLPGITSSITDVRLPISLDLPEKPEWIFNLAAIHREPGHEPEEFYHTNIKGAEQVCDFAERVGCSKIYFTSSIAVYGYCLTKTDENKEKNPVTPYGSSKIAAEQIHQNWASKDTSRRLIISRPGVIYGPGDPGNIMRMIKAIRKGYFAIPGSKHIHKSYAYIYGFLESIDYTMARAEQLISYNYVETPTETLDDVTRSVKNIFKSNAPIVAIPLPILVSGARVLQIFLGKSNPIHPVRVRKAATPTYIVPQVLLDLGFQFKYDFTSSIKHWLSVAPEDF